MPFFKSKVAKEPAVRQVPSMGSGLRLRTTATVADCLDTIEQILDGYRARKYKHMPAYVVPGWSWRSPETDPPSTVISFNDSNDDFVLATFWRLADGTQVGLFPLGSGDERVKTMPIVRDWQARESSLKAHGVIPRGLIALAAPRITEELISEGVTLAGFPATQENLSEFAQGLAFHLNFKAMQGIAAKDQLAADRFVAAHRWDGGPLVPYCQAILDDLVTWDPTVLPYIQELPLRMRALMLEEGVDRPSEWVPLPARRG